MRRFPVILALFVCAACSKTEIDDPNDNPPANRCAAITQQQHFDCFLDSLQSAGASDLTKVNEIRKYLANRMDIGNSLDPLAETYENDPTWSTVNPFNCLDGFEQNMLTGKCGFCSTILVKLYEYAGFESYRYFCGFPAEEYSTHKFVIVKVNGQWILQDAFYDYTLTGQGGNARDFLEMIPDLRTGNYSDIEAHTETVPTQLWVENQHQLDSLNTIFGDYGTIERVDTVNGRIMVILKREYHSLTDAALRLMSPVLQQDGLPVNYFSLFTKPISIRNSRNQEMDSIMNMIPL